MSSEHLSVSGETAWRSLRQHLEWAEGFWLGWVFTDYTPSVHELHRRAEVLLRGVGRTTVLRQLQEPTELVDVLLWLNAGAGGYDGCVFVAVVRSGDDWRDAWDEFMLRLNERRELIKDKIRGGLLLLAPTSFKGRTREAAPDLWSIRSLAVEVAPVVGEMPEARMVALIEPEAVEGSDTEVTLALQAVNAASRAGQLDAEVEARIRAARALFAVGRRDEGREQAVLAVERAPTPRLTARALVVLANIERELNDRVAAERHYQLAIGTDPEAVEAWDYLGLADLLRARHALPEARRAAEAGLAKSHVRQQRYGATVELLQAEMASYLRLGGVKEVQGELRGALEAFEAGLALSRRLRLMVGNTVRTLQDEARSLQRVADIKRVQGDLVGARGRYEAMMSLYRRAREMAGDTPETVRDESVGLESLGDVQRAQGDLDGAKKACVAGLFLKKLRLEMVGETEEALRDVARSSGRLGDVYRAQGDLQRAAEMYSAMLKGCRRLRAMVGDTADALRDESLSLERLGDLKQQSHDFRGSGEAYTESLLLCRRIAALVGRTVLSLEDVAVKLQRYALVKWQFGRHEEAYSALIEAADLICEVQDRSGKLPRNTRLLEDIRHNVVTLASEMKNRSK